MSFRFIFLTTLALSIIWLIVFLQPCRFSKNCEVSGRTYLISESAEKRKLAKEALRNAENRFRVLFKYKSVSGSVLLDRGVEEPFLVRPRSHWKLRFDPIGAQPLMNVLADKEFSLIAPLVLPETGLWEEGPIVSPGKILSVSLGDQKFDATMHEICHVFFANSMRGVPYSDALDEVAAVSCETDAFLSLRVQDFKAITKRIDPVSWDEFLRMRHPVKGQRELAKALSAGVSRAETSLSFALDSESDLGRSVDLFYSRAAVFALFWQARCPGMGVLTDLAESMAENKKFSEWLAASDSECVPSSIAEFEVSLGAMLEQA